MFKIRGLILLLLFSAAVEAAADPVPYDFAPAGVKAAGLGGAFTSLADDAGALYANPAGMFQIGRNAFSYQIQSILKIQRLIDSSLKLDWDLLPLTALSFPFAGGRMSGAVFISSLFRSMSETYTVHGTGFSWSWQMNSRVAVGLSSGVAVGHQDDNWSLGWFLHAGVLVRVSEQLRAGAVWQAPVKLHWRELRGDYDVDEKLPWRFQGGVSYRISQGVAVSFELEYQGMQAQEYRAGGVDYAVPGRTGLFRNFHPHLGVQITEPRTGALLRFGFLTAGTATSSGAETRPALCLGIGAYTAQHFRLDFALQDSLLFDIFTGTDRYEWLSVSMEYHF